MVNEKNNIRERNQPLAFAFWGSVIPEDMCNSNPTCNVAGNKFQIQFLDALHEATAVAPEVFSIMPIGAFPKSRSLFIKSKTLNFRGGLTGRLMPFLNVIIFKQLTLLLANFLVTIHWLWKHRGKNRFIFVYNLFPPLTIPTLIATRMLGGKAIAVVADFPHNLSFDFHGWKGLLQRINVYLESSSLSHFSGIIPFTRYIVEDFAPGKPMFVMEGGVDINCETYEPETTDSQECICFFSGTLYEINGIDLLLKAFRLISDPKFRLWIFGCGPLESKVRAASLNDNRIVYWGFLPNEEVMRHQRRATVLLNVRPTNQLITRYTFPSKLREYMLSGRPVITTALSGIPEEYFDFVYVLRDETPEGIARFITDVCRKPLDTLDKFGTRAREFILRNKNWTLHGRNIYEFIRSL